MRFLEVNPRYRELFDRLGLTSAAAVLALPAVVVSGHAERHVARVTLGEGQAAVPAFLKREHRVRRRHRLANAWAGFGLVSKAEREASVLHALGQAGVDCPAWIAFGEDDQGRAFLLVRALDGAVELRDWLRRKSGRRRRARRLGAALARIHEAGFDHPDLYAKHVLVDARAETVHFLDWQRSRWRSTVGWKKRCRDLAALEATLSGALAAPRDRLECLRAYLRAAGLRLPLRRAARQVRAAARRLLRRRHVRASRALPPPAAPQRLIWLDGEALCVTPEFQAEWPGRMPDWLSLTESVLPAGAAVTATTIALPGDRRAVLKRRRAARPWACLWAWLRGQRLASPEVRRAGLLFRRQREGQPTPRLLAFGQRLTRPWRLDSFLLTEPLDGTSAAAVGGGRYGA